MRGREEGKGEGEEKRGKEKGMKKAGCGCSRLSFCHLGTTTCPQRRR